MLGWCVSFLFFSSCFHRFPSCTFIWALVLCYRHRNSIAMKFTINSLQKRKNKTRWIHSNVTYIYSLSCMSMMTDIWAVFVSMDCFFIHSFFYVLNPKYVCRLLTFPFLPLLLSVDVILNALVLLLQLDNFWFVILVCMMIKKIEIYFRRRETKYMNRKTISTAERTWSRANTKKNCIVKTKATPN